MPKYPCSKSCNHCNNEFIILRAWSRNQQYCSRGCSNAASRTRVINSLSECQQCGKDILQNKNQTKFCSRSCAATYNNAQRPSSVGERHSRILKEKYSAREKTCRRCKANYCGAHTCNTIITKESITKPSYIRCCASCNSQLADNRKKYCKLCFPNARHYRSLASFKFNVYKFPDQFNVDLINIHGWFSPNGYGKRNKSPNLSGVSRDHLYTVADGFKNKIPPELLAHPANCEIKLHNGPNGNNSKRKSSISLDELMDLIQKWNTKFGG